MLQPASFPKPVFDFIDTGHYGTAVFNSLLDLVPGCIIDINVVAGEFVAGAFINIFRISYNYALKTPKE